MAGVVAVLAAARRARKNIARADAARSAYYTFISGEKWGDRQHYDLCVDSSAGAEAEADAIVSYVQARLANESGK